VRNLKRNKQPIIREKIAACSIRSGRACRSTEYAGSMARQQETPSCIFKKNLVLSSKVIAMRTTITSRGQTVVPAKIRKDHQIHPPMQLEWIDDGETIRVVPIPRDPIRAAKGSSRGLRQGLLRERGWERRRD
jgi:bifunctional DNA-binding transcriptional regulator/antitoxin component of YhaV-PrlF toxin-antitoxin module